MPAQQRACRRDGRGGRADADGDGRRHVQVERGRCPTALADGTYDVKATATDNAGNVGTDNTTNELTVDTVKPTVTVNTLTTNNNKPTLTGTVNDPTPSSGISGVTVTVGAP